MRLNRKGFASSVFIYSIFLFFIMTIMMILVLAENENQNLKFGNEQLKYDVNKIVPYDVILND